MFKGLTYSTPRSSPFLPPALAGGCNSLTWASGPSPRTDGRSGGERAEGWRVPTPRAPRLPAGEASGRPAARASVPAWRGWSPRTQVQPSEEPGHFRPPRRRRRRPPPPFVPGRTIPLVLGQPVCREERRFVRQILAKKEKAQHRCFLSEAARPGCCMSRLKQISHGARPLLGSPVAEEGLPRTGAATAAVSALRRG